MAQKTRHFTWKTSKTKTPVSKVQLNENDIKQWVKRVERASEYAVSEVFSIKKPLNSHKSVPLESIDQLQDHNDAYSEAQSILSQWMNQKLRLESEMDDDDEEEEKMVLCEADDLETKHMESSCSNFDDLYHQLEQEEENTVVHNFLQDLMDTEVLEAGIPEALKLDSDEMKKKWRDPSITMDVRHKQVKENRMRRDAEREKLHREKEVLKEAREEARLLEEERQRKRRQEVRRQEELIQQEMIRLRREMDEKKSMEQLARNLERERLQKQRATKSIVSSNHHNPTPNKDLELKNLGAKVQLLNLQSMQRHFSTWYSVILERRVRMGKAAALCDWRTQLRAWRAWRALVWVRREEKEAEKTEEELRVQYRRCQQALESNRKRLLRRCFSDWRVWCQVEFHRKELQQQQEETRLKMAALISVATSRKLGAEKPPPSSLPAEALYSITETIPPQQQKTQTEATVATTQRRQEIQRAPQSSPSTTKTTCRTGHFETPPTQAWQVTRRHAALSKSELRESSMGQQQQGSHQRELRDGQFNHRHTALQQTVTEQRKLLKEQQQQILLLQKRQNILELRHEADKTALRATVPTGTGTTSCLPQPDTEEARGNRERPKGASRENSSSHIEQKPSLYRVPLPHPAVQAMEERARQRSERRKEVEELRRQKQEEKLAQMKATEEERLRVEEEEKQKEMERKKEERRFQKMKELEKQRRAEREQELSKLAAQHYLNTLFRSRGLSPWKRLLKQTHANTQRARDHSSRVLLRRCFFCWSRFVSEAQGEQEARASQLYQCFLLQRTLRSWRRLKDVSFILEARAERFHRTHTQRRVLKALLDHLTEQRITAWDNEQRAQEHHLRQVVRKCFAGWRRLPVVLREEKEREVRREQLRRKVAEILPDFRSSPVELWRPVNPL